MLDLETINNKFIELYDETIPYKTLRKDLSELGNSVFFNVDVYHEKEGTKNYYRIQDRLFEIQELRMLVDAVSSAKFISRRDSDQLIEKIRKLTSIPSAVQLENHILLEENEQRDSQQVKYAIFMLHNAIFRHQYIQFKYGNYDVTKTFTLHHDGDEYLIKPLCLVWNNDFYYLIGEHLQEITKKTNNNVKVSQIRHYRVDRMRQVDKIDEHFITDPNFNLNQYVNRLFFMYSGVERHIEIQFDNHLINVVIDRFGLDIDIRPAGDHVFRISTEAVYSDGLVRWLLTWGSDAKVIAPTELAERMKSEALKMYQQY
ncbi:MAG: WYL domain-containing protein [Sporolactobacillus sp.]